jgi:predicted nucleotidyltransferase
MITTVRAHEHELKQWGILRVAVFGSWRAARGSGAMDSRQALTSRIV